MRVRALIAHTNRGGSDKVLRKLELRAARGGVTVSRTADDLIRYHGKMMIVDSRVLHVYGFNFTGLDIAKSRSFGIVTKNPKLVQEATKLFKADFDAAAVHARLRSLRRQPRERPRAAERVHQRRAPAAAHLRPAGQRRRDAAPDHASGSRRASTCASSAGSKPKWNIRRREVSRQAAARPRDHPRRRRAFIGSQSLRRLELEKRREVGIIVTDETRRQADDGRVRAGLGADRQRREGAKKAEKAERRRPRRRTRPRAETEGQGESPAAGS